MSWSDTARETIARVHAELPEDISFKDRKAAINAAYPFGERRYWPHKAWCKARREYLRRYDPKAPTPPLIREMLRDRVEAGEIEFPFATPSDEERK